MSVACAQTKKADFRRACLENALRPYYGIQNQRPGARGVNQQQQALHCETPQMPSCSPLTGRPKVIIKSRLHGVPGEICASRNERNWRGEGPGKPVLGKTFNNYKVPQLNGHILI